MGGRPDLILVGHNVIHDMRVLKQYGLDLINHFNLIGIADTQVLIQDAAIPRMGQSLTDLVPLYELYPPVFKQYRTKRTFLGSHCAGNDAVANLKGFK